MRLKLAQAGVDVCAEARSGHECVQLTQQHLPDVVLMDYGLPGLNGVAATRAIRRTLPAVEVLFLTGYDSDRIACEAVEVGVRGFLLKTDARDHLVPAVLSLAEHKPYFLPPVSTLFLQYGAPGGESRVKRSTTASPLTARELEIVHHIASGKSSKEVATALDISTRTVEAHRSSIFMKLQLRSVTELVLYAVRNQIIQP